MEGLENMSKQEIVSRIENIKQSIFLRQMKDHWSSDDFRADRIQSDALRKLEARLQELEQME